MEKRAEIVYHKRCKYHGLPMGEGYAINIYNDQHPEGALKTYFQLKECAKPDDIDGKDYIHCDIIAELNMLLKDGYVLDFNKADRPLD